MTGPASAVEAATWPDLLPPHRLDGGDQPVGGPAYVDGLRLSDRHWLALVADGRRRTYPVPLLETGTGVRRARPGEGAAQSLLDTLARGGDAADHFTLTSWHGRPASGERSVGVDQSNESVVVGGSTAQDGAVLKWMVEAAPGPHPAQALLGRLQRAGFTGMPRPWGLVTWRPDGEAEPRLLASVVSFVPGAVDGWTWAVDDLRAAVLSRDTVPLTRVGERVGVLVADLHSALSDSVVAAGAQQSGLWRAGAEADLTHALEVTRGRARRVLLSHADAVRAAWLRLPDQVGTPMMTVHGDLHVGQLLRSPNAADSLFVTDFDGSPVARAEDRTALAPAAVDVAGMAQSLTHAGLVLRRHEPALDAAAVAAMSEVLVSSYLSAYRRASRRNGHAGLLDETLVGPLRLRQVCREFSYAAEHLPRWSYVPEAALPALVENGSQ